MSSVALTYQKTIQAISMYIDLHHLPLPEQGWVHNMGFDPVYEVDARDFEWAFALVGTSLLNHSVERACDFVKAFGERVPECGRYRQTAESLNQYVKDRQNGVAKELAEKFPCLRGEWSSRTFESLSQEWYQDLELKNDEWLERLRFLIAFGLDRNPAVIVEEEDQTSVSSPTEATASTVDRSPPSKVEEEDHASGFPPTSPSVDQSALTVRRSFAELYAASEGRRSTSPFRRRPTSLMVDTRGDDSSQSSSSSDTEDDEAPLSTLALMGV
jgi:hypothetical protein